MSPDFRLIVECTIAGTPRKANPLRPPKREDERHSLESDSGVRRVVTGN